MGKRHPTRVGRQAWGGESRRDQKVAIFGGGRPHREPQGKRWVRHCEENKRRVWERSASLPKL